MPLPVEVAFEAVPDRLEEQGSTATGGEHDGHRPRSVSVMAIRAASAANSSGGRAAGGALRPPPPPTCSAPHGTVACDRPTRIKKQH